MKKLFCLLLAVITAIAIVAGVSTFILNRTITSDQNHKGKVNVDRSRKYPDWNVVLISIDTLRADHLGCYGYSKNTTPHIDRFSKDSVLFSENIAQASSTAASHASIFTSLIPSHHGASFSAKTPIPEETMTMAEILKDNNYRTISYNGGAQVVAKFGFDQGFDVYESYPGKGDHLEKTFIGKVQAAIKWIKSNPNEPFFLFLHTYEVHHPYTPQLQYLDLFEQDYSGKLPAHIPVKLLRTINKGEVDISRQDKDHIINAYDAEIYSMDNAFGALVGYLKKEKLYDKTIIIFTSDHGEEFGEHGRMGWHSHALYDEQLKVPLIIKFQDSKYASQIIHEQTRGIDILPTLLDILGISTLESFEGVSLIGYLTGTQKEQLFAVSQQDTRRKNRPTAIRTKKWKLYGSKLFNLRSDPQEQKNLASKKKKVYGKMRNKLDHILNRKQAVAKSRDVKLDEQEIKRLQTLGYAD